MSSDSIRKRSCWIWRKTSSRKSWKRLPKAVEEPPALEVLKSHMDVALGDVVCWCWLMVGLGDPGGLFQPGELCDSMKCCPGSLELPKNLSKGFTDKLKEQRENGNVHVHISLCSPASSLIRIKEGMEPKGSEGAEQADNPIFQKE